MFRLKHKKSDSQLPQTNLETKSSGTETESADKKKRASSSSDSPTRPDAESRHDLALQEVRNYLAGRLAEVSRIEQAEKDIRMAVAEELMSVMAGYKSESVTTSSNAERSGSSGQVAPTTEGTADPHVEPSEDQAANIVRLEQERARQLFVDHGYFDEAIESLRSGSSPGERAAAARIIGRAGNRLGSVHLIAALFDDAEEVRDAATAALAQLGEATASVAATPLSPENGGPTAPLDNPELAEVAPTIETQPEPDTTENQASGATLKGESVPQDEAKLLLEEAAARKELEELRHRLDETARSRAKLQRKAEQRLESEARLSAEAAKRRLEEEALRKRAEEEVVKRRRDEEKRLATAHTAAIKAEEEAERFAQEDARLRLEVSKLRVAAEEIARTRVAMQAERLLATERDRLAEVERARQQAETAHLAEMERLRSEEEALSSALAENTLRRTEIESARHEANQQTLRLAEEKEHLEVLEAARQAEAERLREAEEKTRAEQEQLSQQVEEMRRLAEEVAARRVEVEAAREKAAAEAQHLVEAQARMKAAEEARQQAEAERSRVEAELIQKAEAERRLLDEVRLRAEEEKQRLEMEERYRAAEQEQRLSHLAALRQQLGAEAQQRAEAERHVSNQIESLRVADMQARKRIEDAEARRRTAEDSFRLVAEKTQRVEAEACKSEQAEQQIVAKLEEIRRNVAVATQSAAEQEKRIKEETEQLRRLEEAQRHRVEEAARVRAETEQRLQQERDRLRAEESARLRASEQFNRLSAPPHHEAAEAAEEWHDDPAENLRASTIPAEPQTSFVPAPAFAAPFAAAATAARAPEMGADKEKGGSDGVGGSASGLVPAILATEGDDFSRISKRFDEASAEVRNAAARELRELDPSRMVELFTRALEEASPERRANIGGAIAASGLAGDVIDMLGGESREETYSALCLLLAMAKTGEVQPLVRAIESHENVYVRIAAVRLLTLNGQEEIANAAARRRLEGNA